MNDDRIALNGATGIARVPDPGWFEEVDIGSVDLIQTRIMGPPVVAMVNLPMAITLLGIDFSGNGRQAYEP